MASAIIGALSYICLVAYDMSKGPGFLFPAIRII